MRPSPDQEFTPFLPASYRLTAHACKRMSHRGISLEALSAAVYFGRVSSSYGQAEVFVIGRREVEQARSQGFNLSAYEGVQVVCSVTGRVLTAYRDRRIRKRRN